MLKLVVNSLRNSHTSITDLRRKRKRDLFTEDDDCIGLINKIDFKHGKITTAVTTNSENSASLKTTKSACGRKYLHELSTSENMITKEKRVCDTNDLRIKSREVASRLAERRQQNRLRIARAAKAKRSSCNVAVPEFHQQPQPSESVSRQKRQRINEQGQCKRKRDTGLRTMEDIEFLMSEYEKKLNKIRDTTYEIFKQTDGIRKTNTATDRSEVRERDIDTGHEENTPHVPDHSRMCTSSNKDTDSENTVDKQCESCFSLNEICFSCQIRKESLFIRRKAIRRKVVTPAKRVKRVTSRPFPKLIPSPQKHTGMTGNAREIIMDALAKDEREFTFC